LDDITFHGLRHSFVAIMVAAGCNVREVSEWAGHNSVAFTLTRYGGLFEDGAEAAIDRLRASWAFSDARQYLVPANSSSRTTRTCCSEPR
jgi:integrase